MNNKEFIAALAKRTGYSPSATQRMVNTVVGAMTKEFENSESVYISDFGTFEVKKKLERVIVNPATQQKMLVPPKFVLQFKPQSRIKAKLK